MPCLYKARSSGHHPDATFYANGIGGTSGPRFGAARGRARGGAHEGAEARIFGMAIASRDVPTHFRHARSASAEAMRGKNATDDPLTMATHAATRNISGLARALAQHGVMSESEAEALQV